MRQGRGTARDTDDRRAAFRRGRHGEWAALWWLRLKGYRILAQDFRSPAGEIDVVARRGSILAIVEVKARDSVAAAVEAIMPAEAPTRRRARNVKPRRLIGFTEHPQQSIGGAHRNRLTSSAKKER